VGPANDFEHLEVEGSQSASGRRGHQSSTTSPRSEMPRLGRGSAFPPSRELLLAVRGRLAREESSRCGQETSLLTVYDWAARESPSLGMIAELDWWSIFRRRVIVRCHRCDKHQSPYDSTATECRRTGVVWADDEAGLRGPCGEATDEGPSHDE